MDAAHDNPAVFAPAAWACLAASYLLFAGQISLHEVIAGFAASLAAAAYALIAHRSTASFSLRLPWLRLVGTIVRLLVVDTIRIGPALIRAAPGAVSGEKSLSSNTGQRAVDILFQSAGPNGFVVRSDASSLFVHRLVDAEQTH